MKVVPFCFLSLMLVTACSVTRRPNVTVRAEPGPVAAKTLDVAAASVAAASHANDSNPPSPAQEATAAELEIAAASLPPPSDETREQAIARVETALGGELDKARSLWREAQAEATTLYHQLERERAEAAKTLQRLKDDYEKQLEAERIKHERQQRHMLNWLFLGGGFLLILIGVGCFTFLEPLPFFGPKVGLMFGAAGVGLIASGIAINWVLDNKWVLWLLIVPLGIAAGLTYANNFHHEKTKLQTYAR